MTKATSSKKRSKPDNEGKVVEQDKASLKPKKKMGSEIDEIFAGKKRKRAEKEKKSEAGKPAKVSVANTKLLNKTKIGKSSKSSNAFEENSSADRASRPRKKTADGLTVYTEEELGIGKPGAGGTFSFLNLILNALAKQLAKAKLSWKLFLEPDLLPLELQRRTSVDQI